MRVLGYEIEAHVARGGMGDVYRARVDATGERVALKVMREAASFDDERSARERFAREARLLAGIEHPNIVRYVAHGTTLDDRPFLAAEWLEGPTLTERIARGRIATREAVHIAAAIADALVVAHDAGIVHRDVKPSNIVLTMKGIPVLIDFGVAKLGEQSLTRTGALVGSHGYMAPEQLRGAADISPAADVWALGCVIYRALGGQTPFEAASEAEMLAKMLGGAVPDVRERRRDAPAELAELVTRMLHASPEARPSIREVAERLQQLEAVSAAEPPREDPVTVSEQSLVTVVVVAATNPDDPTTPSANVQEETSGRLQELFRARGARVELLPNGACVAIFGPRPALGEQVHVAAQGALVARAIMPGRPVAIATGRAEITGRSAMGDAISRALALVRKGSIDGALADEASASLLASRFVVSAGGAVTAERSVPEAARTVRGRVVPMYGRDTELSLLEKTWAEARASGRGASVLLVGAAGAGKTRLAAELALRVRPLGGADVVVTRTDPLGSGAPFALARSIARALAPVATDTAQPNIAPFVAHLLGVASDDDEAVRAARLDPALMRDRLREAFHDVVRRACRSRNVLLVVEDVQWADMASLKTLASTVSTVEAPLLVLGLARPEVREGPPPFGKEAIVVDIGPLGPRDAAALARAILGEEAHDTAVERIVRLGDGHAFFLEELARAALATDDLPDSVLAVTQARLGALPLPSRHVLRAASLLRPRITRDGLVDLLGTSGTAASLDATIDDLVAREIFVRSEGAFFFRHELLAEAAYASLTEDDARRGHLAAASFFVSAGGDPRRIAEHYERGGDRVRAASYWVRTAELAVDGDDRAGATSAVDRAEACGASDVLLGRALAVRATVERWQGDVARAVALGRDALARLETLDARAMQTAAEVAAAAGSAADDDALDEVADRLAAEEEGGAWHVRALAAVVLSLVRAGHIARADVLLVRAEAIRGALSEDQAIADIGLYGARAARRNYAGDPDAYRTTMPPVLTAAVRVGDARTACLTRAHLGYGWAAVGEWENADATLRAALEEADRLGLSAARASALHNLGRVLEAGGDLEGGADLQRSALELSIEQRNARLAAACRLYLASNRLRAGKTADALLHAKLAASSAREAPLRAWSCAVLAEALVATNETNAAVAQAKEAMAFFTRSGGVGEGDAAVHRAFARALLAAGEREAGISALAAARDRLRARASMIAEPALRKTFLGRVEDVTSTLSLCVSHGVSADNLDA